MEYITRKTMLYKTGVEYGDYTMNHMLGCTHGCKYPCYAFMLKKDSGKSNPMTSGLSQKSFQIHWSFLIKKFRV